MAEGREQTVEIRPPSVRAETLNVLKAAAAIVVIVAAYIFRPVVRRSGHRRSPSQSGLLPYQRLIRDAPPDEQRVFRELQEGLLEAERIRAADRPLARRGDPRGRRDSAVRARSHAEDRLQMDVRPAGLGDQLSRRAVRSRRSRRGCSSSSSPSPARPRIRRRTTKRIIGCPTGRRCTCRSGICRKRSAAAASPRCGCRRTKAGRTGWWDQMRNNDRCLDTEAQSTEKL